MSRTPGSLIGHNVSSRVKATEVPTTATGVTIGQEIEPCKSVAIDWFPMVYYRRLYDISSSSDNGQRYTGSTSICTDFAQRRASQDFKFMISRILDLLKEEEDCEDEYGAVVPTEHALLNVLAILGETHNELQTFFPRAAASVSFDGGIRIQWMHPHSSVRLVIPGGPDEDGYIYFEDEDYYDTESVSAKNLAYRMNWLQRICRNAETRR